MSQNHVELRWLDIVFEASVPFTFFSKTLNPLVTKNGSKQVTCNNTEVFDSLVPINIYTCLLFAGREVRIGKNCARGLGTQDRGHSFSQYGPTWAGK